MKERPELGFAIVIIFICLMSYPSEGGMDTGFGIVGVMAFFTSVLIVIIHLWQKFFSRKKESDADN